MPIFNYAIDRGHRARRSGFADDNYIDGTQSYVFGFISPDIVDRATA